MRTYNCRINIRKRIIRTERVITNLIYPIRCPVCDHIPGYGMLICPECRQKLHYIKEPCCKKCGQPVEDETIEYCYDCSKREHTYHSGRAVFLYQGSIKESLYRFKYANKREYAVFYAQETVSNIGRWIRQQQVDAIIPIPLHAKRRQKRGYNQAELYARSLGELLSIPVYTKILTRVINTHPQKELDDIERKNNLKRAFKCKESIVQSKYILLVDDIYTTGNTVDAASAELIRAGATRVTVVCISIGRGF